MRGIRE